MITILTNTKHNSDTKQLMNRNAHVRESIAGYLFTSCYAHKQMSSESYESTDYNDMCFIRLRQKLTELAAEEEQKNPLLHTYIN